MILNKIDDPRDALAKARRYELLKFAKANGISEITESMPAILMRKILRGRGLTRIAIPPRTLGQMNQARSAEAAPSSGDQVPEIDADADLARQFGQPAAPKPAGDMSINELRAAVKAKGLKIARTDTMESLRAKLAT